MRSHSADTRSPCRRPGPLFGARLNGPTTLLAFALAGSGSGCSSEPPLPPLRPDIVLVSLDTVRADHLEPYGYERETTPNLSTLASEGILFRRAISQAPWTLPSMASMHTGLYPSEHGALNNLSPMPMESPTVAELLQANGYRTQAVVSHVFVGRKYGFGRGFDTIDENHVPGHDGVSSQALTETALALFREPTDAPSFLWVHYFDPHYTYIRHAEHGFATGERGRFEEYIRFDTPDGEELHDVTPEELEYMKAVYDEELAHTDVWVGALLDGVRESARDRPVLFLVTADHGEAFMERGVLGHGKTVHDELVRVPLVIGGDLTGKLRGAVVEPAVETRSIAATILAMAGIEHHAIPGADLIAIAEGEPAPEFVYSEGSYARGADRRKLSVESGPWKLIVQLEDESTQLFNLETDASETSEVEPGPKSEAIREKLADAITLQRLIFATAAVNAEEVDLTDEERQKLDDLGYFDRED